MQTFFTIIIADAKPQLFLVRKADTEKHELAYANIAKMEGVVLFDSRHLAINALDQLPHGTAKRCTVIPVTFGEQT